MHRNWLAGAGLLLLIGAVYFNGLRGDYVLDAASVIRDDPRVWTFSLENIWRAFTQSYYPATPNPQDLYRPITTLSFQLNALLAHDRSPVAFHVVNLLLHAINTMLILAIARRLMTPSRALAAAAIFAVHPLGTEVVTNLAGRADLLCSMAMLAGLIAHVNRRWMLLGLAGLIAVMSKETGIMLVGLIAAWDLCFGGADRRSYAALIPSWIAIGAARWLFLHPVYFEQIGGENPLAMLGFWDRLLAAWSVQGRYLFLFFWPQRLSSDYSFHSIPMPGETWTAWAAIAASTTAATWICYNRRNRTVLFFALIAGSVMLPTCNMLFTIGTIMAERFMYLPMACLAMVLMARFRVHKAIVAAAVLAMGIRTVQRTFDWQNNLSLFTSAVKAQPDSFKSHQELAAELLKTGGSMSLALSEAELAMRIIQDLPLIHRSVRTFHVLAVSLIELDRIESAIAVLEAHRQVFEAAQQETDRRRRAAGLPEVDLKDSRMEQIERLVRSKLEQSK